MFTHRFMKKLSKHYISLPLYIIPALPPGGCGKAGRFATSKKKGDFFRLIWAEIFLHKSLTDSGISHRFLRLFSFYTIARRFEYLHICGIFLHRCRRRVSSRRQAAAANRLPPPSCRRRAKRRCRQAAAAKLPPPSCRSRCLPPDDDNDRRRHDHPHPPSPVVTPQPPARRRCRRRSRRCRRRCRRRCPRRHRRRRR